MSSGQCVNCKFFAAEVHDGYDGYCTWCPPIRLARLIWDERTYHPNADVMNTDVCDAHEFTATPNLMRTVPAASLGLVGTQIFNPISDAYSLALTGTEPTVTIEAEP